MAAAQNKLLLNKFEIFFQKINFEKNAYNF